MSAAGGTDQRGPAVSAQGIQLGTVLQKQHSKACIARHACVVQRGVPVLHKWTSMLSVNKGSPQVRATEGHCTALHCTALHCTALHRNQGKA